MLTFITLAVILIAGSVGAKFRLIFKAAKTIEQARKVTRIMQIRAAQDRDIHAGQAIRGESLRGRHRCWITADFNVPEAVLELVATRCRTGALARLVSCLSMMLVEERVYIVSNKERI